MSYEWENSILPEFPRTEHLPALGNYAPNASSDDKVCSVADAALLRNNQNVWVEEKVDAANSGMCHYDGQPIIRNRNHVLAKGYGRKNTPAKMQFASIWNWYYQNVDKFERLNDGLGFYAAVYGEWMYYRHTVLYDKLPAYFVAYDIWDYEEKHFIATPVARRALIDAGFAVVPLLQQGLGLVTYDELTKYFVQSPWAAAPELQGDPENAKREGVYIKVVEGERIVRRFKMVRPGYKPGEHFTGEKNRLAKETTNV